ncbi:uncharacterized protein LOC110247151 [Exaiptasia diaphana]|uniref:N-acetyltransferase domain-containing protein n=1 Tax=Exaiptasia diaphana TaxID=2652724 RepID=A0A913XSW2_EXADI|nr:uncharacterized protein LOC110247151 [Exaiptasia diaphana]
MKTIPTFTDEIILENDRVKLIPLEASHLELLEKYAIQEPELWTYSLQSGAGTENMKKYIQAALSDREKGVSYPFIVFDKQTNEWAGSTRFYDYQPVHQTVQLGYTWYGKKFHGTGLNKNCKFLILDFAFDQLQLERVEFRADNNNARSIAAMKSIGCVPEGVLRSNCTDGQIRRDSIVLSILKSEWYNDVKTNLLNRISG